ncbi:hypothetical protein CEXT_451011 [Caerostris extrusa]|uniref:Uncharacterized protein n=1 Tax=Caerostris extrusa TaxID=172846 RepID=A0AAV4QLG3_CAEEX|nr:hypothetical protein CEXT_451011 [Caerostris extrusa]
MYFCKSRNDHTCQKNGKDIDKSSIKLALLLLSTYPLWKEERKKKAACDEHSLGECICSRHLPRGRRCCICVCLGGIRELPAETETHEQIGTQAPNKFLWLCVGGISLETVISFFIKTPSL